MQRTMIAVRVIVIETTDTTKERPKHFREMAIDETFVVVK